MISFEGSSKFIVMTYITIFFFVIYGIMGKNQTVRRVSLSGKLVHVNNATFINVTCATELSVYGNTAEFIVNNVSEDQVRFNNGICYHKHFICSNSKCSCASTGNVFSWTFEIFNYYNNVHIACRMRLEENNIQFAIVAFVLFNAFDFIDGGEEYDSAIGTATTQKPDNTNTGGLSVMTLAFILAGSLCFICIFCTGLYLMKRKQNCQNTEDVPLVLNNNKKSMLYLIIYRYYRTAKTFAYCIDCECFMCNGCSKNHKTNHICGQVEVLCQKKKTKCVILCKFCRRPNANVESKTGIDFLCCVCTCSQSQVPCNIIPLLTKQTSDILSICFITPKQIRKKYQTSGRNQHSFFCHDDFKFMDE